MAASIENPGNYHAALYIRLSKEDESLGPSESVSNQLSLLLDFARRQGLAVFDTYIDDGWSGTSFDRPDFLRMIADIEAKRVNMVITKDLSRLGRDYILTGHYMERFFPEHQVRYISLLDGIDTGIETSANDITPFRAIMNDMYAKDISRKISSVKHDKQRRGLFIGGKALFGYRLHPTEKNRIVIDEGAAPVVRRVFGLALQGLSCRQIALTLNQEEVPTPAAYAGLAIPKPGPYTGLWSSERISDMLQNETYTGSMVQGRSRKISYKSKKCIRCSPKDWVVVEGTHEAIIDKESFRKVQALLASRRHTRSRTYDFPLKGLIICHECGRPLAVINRKNAKGEDTLYFVCRTYQRFTKAGVCSCHNIKEQTVTQAVSEKLAEICGPYLNIQALLPAAQQALEQRRAEKNAGQEADGLRARLETLTAQLDRTYTDKLEGILEEEDFRRVYAKLRKERDQLQRRLQQLDSPALSAGQQAAEAEELAKRFAAAAPRMRELLVSLIERVELTEKKELILRFRFRKPEA